MSWSLTVPKQETTDEFLQEIYKAKETPKADGRTKAGKLQKAHVLAAKNALEELGDYIGATSGSASGHIAPDLTGYVSVTAQAPAP